MPNAQWAAWLLFVSLPSTTFVLAQDANGPAADGQTAGATQMAPLERTGTESGSSSEESGISELPHENGQVWRNYDIRAYCAAVGQGNHPESAVVDWILRETGYEIWHSEIPSMLSANGQRVLAYHTPEVQKTVRSVVDRFVQGAQRNYRYTIQVVSVGHPNWRVRAQAGLRSLPLQSPGVQAWTTSPEGAVQLLGELRRRNDFREQTAPQLLAINGQSTLLAQSRPIDFVQELVSANGGLGYTGRQVRMEQGYRLELSPLPTLDGQYVDTMLKFEVKELEKLVPVMLDTPSPSTPRGRAKVEIPQTAEFRWHETVRWPSGQVLVVSLGLVPSGVINTASRPLGFPLPGTSPKADLLLFIDGRPASPQGMAQQGTPGRY